MLNYLLLFLVFIFTNTLLYPWASKLWNPEPEILQSWYSSVRSTKHDNDLYNPNFITIDNFHLQSNFKPYRIAPYNGISRGVFEKWIEEQCRISFDNILKNIGDIHWSNDLVEKESVSLGAVIASPNKDDPDYFYQWVRDGAITINSVVNYLTDSEFFKNQSLQITIENYLNNSYTLQRTNNPSGPFTNIDLLSLGEPKFHVDGQPFTENWGRPQNDGPPLRLIAIDNFFKGLEKFSGNLIQKDGELKTLEDIYHKIMKLDLHYILKYWSHRHFDLWEEIHSFHFFTSLTQLKALKIGLKYFEKFNDQDKAFGEFLKKEYQNLLTFIIRDSGFVAHSLNHIVETPEILYRRSGLDVAVLIASTLTHDDEEEDKIPFDVNDGLVLNTLSELVKSMKFIYPINHSKINLNVGAALGRYPEDVYDGHGISEGNPWFLSTLYAGEVLFKLINTLYSQEKNLLIDSRNQHFYFNHIIEINNLLDLASFKKLDTRNFILNIPYNSIAFNQTVQTIFQFADSFLDVVREHVSDSGTMSEQFNKYTGFMQGAENLTWSYGAFWSSYRWRQKAVKLIGLGDSSFIF